MSPDAVGDDAGTASAATSRGVRYRCFLQRAAYFRRLREPSVHRLSLVQFRLREGGEMMRSAAQSLRPPH